MFRGRAARVTPKSKAKLNRWPDSPRSSLLRDTHFARVLEVAGWSTWAQLLHFARFTGCKSNLNYCVREIVNLGWLTSYLLSFLLIFSMEGGT